MLNCDRDIVEVPEVGNNWRNDKVMGALSTVFRNKCYICENKCLASQKFQVDHFIPQNEDENLKYEWSNLYLCCPDCNAARKKKTPEGGYLDPCDPNDDVETEILYILEPYDFDEPQFITASKNPSNKVRNTILQLKQCHYGTEKTKIKMKSFREVIAKRAKKLITLILEVRNAKKLGDHITAQIRNNNIDLFLEKDAPFTMLMRNIADKYR